MDELPASAWVCHALAKRSGGDRLTPVAAVARHFGTQRRVVLDGTQCPWRDEKNPLIVAFPAHRVLEVFRVWGWPEPRHVVDLFAEYRAATNDISGESADPDVRDALRRVPNSVRCSDDDAAEWARREEHCAAVTKALSLLWPTLGIDLRYAFQRGRYANAVAAMQDRGIPVSEDFRQQAGGLLSRLGSAFGDSLPGGSGEIGEAARLAGFQIGDEGRSRYDLRPYAARTGRNQPLRHQYAWDGGRCLISPPEGKCLVVVDYAAQEFGIAANLSGDPAMIDDYYGGDAYLSFGKHVGVHDRALLKRVFLPLMYGQPAIGISGDQQIEHHLAKRIEEAHRQRYRRYWQWTEEAKSYFLQHGKIFSVYGWWLHASPGSSVPMPKRLRTVSNFPTQANGTEILWEACRRLHQAGLAVCGVNHDAVMVEADVSGHADVAHRVEELLAEASAHVVGRPIRTDTEVVLAGNRLRKGKQDWEGLSAALNGGGVA